MSGGRPVSRLAGRLTGAALATAALLAAAACSPGMVGKGEQTESETAEAAAPPPAAVLAEEEPPPAPEESASPPPPPRLKPALVLTVAPGDTLSEIAWRHGVASRRIVELNGLTHPDRLLAGQRLQIPQKAVRTRPADEPRYAGGESGTRPAAAGEPAGAVQVAALVPPVESPGRAGRAEDVAPTRTRAAAPDARHTPANPTPPPATEADVRLARAGPIPEAKPGGHSVTLAEPSPSRSKPLRGAENVPLPPSRNTFLWPTEGRVISRFGAKPGGMHNDGINIAVPLGSDIRAAQSGVVAYAGNELRGYGNLVLIRHEDGWMTAYAHNESLLVEKGDMVRRGQVISRSGRSGRVSSPQAHFEIRRNGEPQDPLRLFTRK